MSLAAVAQNSGTPQFIKHTLTNDFISEGVAVADVNNDGKPDILAGAYWFEAPAWTRHELAPPRHYDPATQFSSTFLDFALDVNQDGWTDLVRIGLPGEDASWYENPKGRDEHWINHPLLSNAGNESPALVDVDGDGRPDLLCNDPVAKEMIWLKSPTVKGDTSWTRYVIAKGETGTNRYTHGLGLIDMNGDGRADVVITKGWWEAPADRTQSNWTFHPATLGEDCSQIYALDLQGRAVTGRDAAGSGKGTAGHGATALVSASAHKYGIWWHERISDSVWKQHLIFDKFSESHGLGMADLNGDGYPDLVTGKRYFAHNGEDPGAYEPSVLYWFEFKPGANPQWIPHPIDDNSGVGLQVVIYDLNKDGLKDIIVSNKKGVFFFEQQKK
jgi:hypothetical protein